MSDPKSSAPVPAAVSLLGLLGLVLLVFAFALANEVEGVVDDAPPTAVIATLVKDPLTGRLLGSDGKPMTPESGWGSEDMPIRLRFVPSGDAGKASTAIEGLLSWLRDRTGFHLKGATSTSYGLVVEEITVGRCEIAFLTAASYARARLSTQNNDIEGDEVEAVLSAVRQGGAEYPGSDLAYRGAILVPKDSPLKSLDDITAETTIAMGNRTSGAGSILPSALLNSRGVRPKILRVANYGIIISSVVQGSADAGCIFWSPPNADNPQNDARILVTGSYPDIFKTTRILGFTPWIPNEPVVVRASLPEDLKRVMARAISLYVNTMARTEAGRRELEAVGSVVGFIPATDRDYDILMETIQQAFANDPEGWKDFQGKR